MTAKPDAQQVLFRLSRLEIERTRLAQEANAAWVAGKRRNAKKIARQVVAIEEKIKRLLEDPGRRPP